MDLIDILNKTKKRSEQIKNVRKPPGIALNDRPYSIPIPHDFKKDEQLNESDKSSSEKTSNKPATNRQQIDNKPATNRQQNRQQSDNKPALKKQTSNKPATEPATELKTNWQQSDNKPATKASFSMLIGLQRNCLLFIYQSCKSNRSKVTEPLSLEHISQYVKASTGTIKTTLQRLVEKNYLLRTGYKNGRGGWSIFEIPETIFTEILRLETDSKLATNWQQTGNKPITQPTTQPITNASSSSVLNIKTTTNLNEEFININFDELESVGFTKNHLYQITTRSNLPANLIQESIDAFAFDLKKNNKAASFKKRPLDVFMGLLTKGSVYLPPENYETPQQESMRLFLARKRAIIEKDKKQQEEALELAFEAWSNKKMNQPLIQELISKIEPWMKKNEMVVRAELYSYYKENVWSTEKENFLNCE